MLSPIKSNVSKKLLNRNYRHRFFQVRTEDEIASGLRQFRKKRGLKQSALAALCNTKQSAISRIEQASYAKWRFDTLLTIAKELDVRVRITLEDMADVIKQYEHLEATEETLFEDKTNPNGYQHSGTVGDWGEISGEVNPRYVS